MCWWSPWPSSSKQLCKDLCDTVTARTTRRWKGLAAVTSGRRLPARALDLTPRADSPVSELSCAKRRQSKSQVQKQNFDGIIGLCLSDNESASRMCLPSRRAPVSSDWHTILTGEPSIGVDKARCSKAEESEAVATCLIGLGRRATSSAVRTWTPRQ